MANQRILADHTGFSKKYSFYIATALIITTVIGAGVFGIPYTVAKSGFGYGVLNLVVIGFFVTMMTLYMGEVVLRTKETRQFSGLAEKYMGKARLLLT
jgi:amino acid permease